MITRQRSLDHRCRCTAVQEHRVCAAASPPWLPRPSSLTSSVLLLPLLQVDDAALQALLKDDPELDELLAPSDDEDDLQLPAEMQGSEEDDLRVLMQDQDELRKILDQVGCWSCAVLRCAVLSGRGIDVSTGTSTPMGVCM